MLITHGAVEDMAKEAAELYNLSSDNLFCIGREQSGDLQPFR